MRIAVMGTGGVGGYFGGRLAAAGHDVHFIARGKHLAAIRAGGLRVQSTLGDLHIQPASATDDPASLAPVDLVLFAVKLYDTDAAALQIRPLLRPDTPVITLQNGVDSAPRIAAATGPGHAVPGLTYIAAGLVSPGVVQQTGPFARMLFGAGEGAVAANVAAFREAAGAAGVEAEVPADIDAELWRKFIFLSSFAGVTAVTRRPLGPILADPDTRGLLAAAVSEAAAVALARGVALPSDAASRTMAFAETLPPGMNSSQAQDRERGKPLELESLSGAVVRFGAETGVPTPVHSFLYAALKLDAGGLPGTPAKNGAA